MTAQETTTPRTRPSKAKAQALAPKPGSEAQGVPEAAAEPEVAPESAEDIEAAWERLTTPMGHPPVFPVWPPALWAAFDTAQAELRAGYNTDRTALHGWWIMARERTFGPLDSWLSEPPFPVPAGVAEDALEPLPEVAG